MWGKLWWLGNGLVMLNTKSKMLKRLDVLRSRSTGAASGNSKPARDCFGTRTTQVCC